MIPKALNTVIPHVDPVGLNQFLLKQGIGWIYIPCHFLQSHEKLTLP